MCGSPVPNLSPIRVLPGLSALVQISPPITGLTGLSGGHAISREIVLLWTL